MPSGMIHSSFHCIQRTTHDFCNLPVVHFVEIGEINNGPVISGAVSEPGNAIAKLLDREKDDRRVVEEIFLSTLGRLPTDAELKDAKLGSDPPHRMEEAQDLAWALLNSPAFLFNR